MGKLSTERLIMPNLQQICFKIRKSLIIHHSLRLAVTMKSPTDRILFRFFAAAAAASTVPIPAPTRRPIQALAPTPNQVILVPPHTAQTPAYTAQDAHPQAKIDILHVSTLPAN